ncbi:MAG TPA: hypothetical protein VIH83_04235 [Candidatus Bathyarchaeia archaeon]
MTNSGNASGPFKPNDSAFAFNANPSSVPTLRPAISKITLAAPPATRESSFRISSNTSLLNKTTFWIV